MAEVSSAFRRPLRRRKHTVVVGCLGLWPKDEPGGVDALRRDRSRPIEEAWSSARTCRHAALQLRSSDPKCQRARDVSVTIDRIVSTARLNRRTGSRSATCRRHTVATTTTRRPRITALITANTTSSLSVSSCSIPSTPMDGQDTLVDDPHKSKHDRCGSSRGPGICTSRLSRATLGTCSRRRHHGGALRQRVRSTKFFLEVGDQERRAIRLVKRRDVNAPTVDSQGTLHELGMSRHCRDSAGVQEACS